MGSDPPHSTEASLPAEALSPRPTPEHASAKRWAASCDTQRTSSVDLLASLPIGCHPVERLNSPEPAAVAACLAGICWWQVAQHQQAFLFCLCCSEPAGEGRPQVVPSALEAWPALSKWDDRYLAALCGDAVVTVNDRAPARHADACCTAGPQRSLRMRLRDYLVYAKVNLKSCLARSNMFSTVP